MSAGHIRQRGTRSWELKFEGPRDGSGKRNIQYVAFRGTKREARIKLAELIASASQGTYIEPSKLAVANHVRARIDRWEASGTISARTAQRYRQLTEGQIVPHIGARPIQKLTAVDIETWHVALKTDGRRRGQGECRPERWFMHIACFPTPSTTPRGTP